MVDTASKFIGGKIKVEAARKIILGYEIKTTVHRNGENPIDVIFLVSDKSGQRQSSNMSLEGVYQLLTEKVRSDRCWTSAVAVSTQNGCALLQMRHDFSIQNELFGAKI